MMGEKFGFSRFFGDEGFFVNLEALEAARGGHSELAQSATTFY